MMATLNLVVACPGLISPRTILALGADRKTVAVETDRTAKADLAVAKVHLT